MQAEWIYIPNPYSDGFICSMCNQLKYHSTTKMFHLIDLKGDLVAISCESCYYQPVSRKETPSYMDLL